jgi:hypothetical protein
LRYRQVPILTRTALRGVIVGTNIIGGEAERGDDPLRHF